MGYLHLEQTGKEYSISGVKIKARKKTNNEWFETQDSIGYWEDFFRPKIIWKRIGSVIRFAYSETDAVCLDSTCFATGDDLKYLVAYLNSTISKRELLNSSPQTGTGDVIISVQALEPLLIPQTSKEKKEEIVRLVDKCLNTLEANPTSDISHIEEQIDNFFFNLFSFNKDEIDFIKDAFI